MPTDGAHAKFLYTILKQLDLKSIDWNAVAGQLDITNGHAARMRFSRFKAQMEGHQPSPRKRAAPGSSPRTKKIIKTEKGEKGKSNCSEDTQTDEQEMPPLRTFRVKAEPMDAEPSSPPPEVDSKIGIAEGQPGSNGATTPLQHCIAPPSAGMQLQTPQQVAVGSPDGSNSPPTVPLLDATPVGEAVKVEPCWDD
ncbi:MAG: hypothetical protein M1832_001269 [Thelocarpon impressellum]|nr:MAG: hypothetical protein M1832_001269 [Thelocarpon impressellum]